MSEETEAREALIELMVSTAEGWNEISPEDAADAILVAGWHPPLPAPSEDEREALKTLIREVTRTARDGEASFHQDAVPALGPNLDASRAMRAALDAVDALAPRPTPPEDVAAIPDPSSDDYAEFEAWEIVLGDHRPVTSMHDGSLAGCVCLDRVFVRGKEDWASHLASVVTGRLANLAARPLPETEE